MAESNATDINMKHILKKVFCDVCLPDGDSVEAATFCVECMEYLCKPCMDSHSDNEFLKNHKTFDKGKLPMTIDTHILRKLKELIFCASHEVQHGYMCEEHAQMICKVCTRKKHRHCKRITKIQSSAHNVLSKVNETRILLKSIKEQKINQMELISNEKKRHMLLRSTILADIQDYLTRINDNHDVGAFDEKVQAIQIYVNSLENSDAVQEKNKEMLQTILHLNDNKKSMVVAKHIELWLENESSIEKQKSENEMFIESVNEIVHISQKLELLIQIKDNVVDIESVNEDENTSVCKLFKSMVMTQKIKGRDVEVQTDSEIDTNEMKLVEGDRCVIEESTASSDVDAELRYAVYGPGKSSMAERLDATNMYVSGQQCDRDCQTSYMDYRRSKRPLSVRSLEFVGTYNICLDNEIACCITGMCVLKKSRRVVMTDWENQCLKVYNEYLEFRFVHKLNWSPYAICVTDEDKDRIAISFGNKKLQCFTVCADNAVCFSDFDIHLNCRGIFTQSKNTIMMLVTSAAILDESGLIAETSSRSNADTIEIHCAEILDGAINSSITSFDKEVYTPIYLIKDLKNNIIIGERNQISAFDTNGSLKWFYKPHKSDKTNYIHGMTMDPEGNIYACSYSLGSIHQVSSFDYTCNRVIIPHIRSPVCVEYDPYHEHLLVGCEDSTSVYVYRFI